MEKMEKRLRQEFGLLELPCQVLWIILERAISLVDGGNIYERWIPLYESEMTRWFRGLMVTCKAFYRCIKSNTVCKPPGDLNFCRVYPIQRVYTVPRNRYASANLFSVCNDASCPFCILKKDFRDAFDGRFIYVQSQRHWVKFLVYWTECEVRREIQCKYFSFSVEGRPHAHLRWNDHAPTLEELSCQVLATLEKKLEVRFHGMYVV